MEQLTDTLLSWQVHPARERWKASLASAAVIGIAGWLAAELMEHAGWGLFAAAVLIVGLNRFFFPTTYELTEEGITAKYPLKTVHYPWRELRRFVYDRAGGFLSPRARRSLLDEYRGISLLFGEGNCCSESPSDPSPLTLTLSPEGRGDHSDPNPLTLALSPEGRGDHSEPNPLTLTLSPERRGDHVKPIPRGDHVEWIIQTISSRLPAGCVIREAGALKEHVSCGG